MQCLNYITVLYRDLLEGLVVLFFSFLLIKKVNAVLEIEGSLCFQKPVVESCCVSL